MIADRFSLTDTHCHLDFHIFDEDREAVIEKARGAGLERILVPGIDLETSQNAIGLAERYPEVYAAVGIHPNSALSWEHSSVNELAELARHPKVVAIGEIGLDYYRLGAPAEKQKEVLRAQLCLAGNLGLPVILHNRDASADILPIVSEWRNELREINPHLAGEPGVFHSYSGDLATAEQILAERFYIGITGPVTFRTAAVLQQIVAAMSLDRLLLETDAPFLTPHPHRGKRNEPAHIYIIAGKIAELRSVDIASVAQSTTQNAARLFHWR